MKHVGIIITRAAEITHEQMMEINPGVPKYGRSWPDITL